MLFNLSAESGKGYANRRGLADFSHALQGSSCRTLALLRRLPVRSEAPQWLAQSLVPGPGPAPTGPYVNQPSGLRQNAVRLAPKRRQACFVRARRAWINDRTERTT